MPTFDTIRELVATVLVEAQDAIDSTMDAYGPAILGVGMLLCGGVVLVLVLRAARRGRLDNAATWVAIATATAFSAEGMWEVAREGLGLSTWQAAGLFAAAEAAMTACAVRARRRHKAGLHPGPDAAAVWIIALAAGCTAALNADSGVEVPVRIGIPLLAAGLWWLELTDRGLAPKPADAITWRITPRRLLVWLRVAQPGQQDLSDYDTERRASALTVAAYRVHHGWQQLRRLHAWRLRRLALSADAVMVTTVHDQLVRVHTIESLTDPTSKPVENQPATRSARTAPVELNTPNNRDRPLHAPQYDEAYDGSGGTPGDAYNGPGVSTPLHTSNGAPLNTEGGEPGVPNHDGHANHTPPYTPRTAQTAADASRPPPCDQPLAPAAAPERPDDRSSAGPVADGGGGDTAGEVTATDRATLLALGHQARHDALPSVRALARLADVAQGTAARALKSLRDSTPNPGAGPVPHKDAVEPGEQPPRGCPRPHQRAPPMTNSSPASTTEQAPPASNEVRSEAIDQTDLTSHRPRSRTYGGPSPKRPSVQSPMYRTKIKKQYTPRHHDLKVANDPPCTGHE